MKANYHTHSTWCDGKNTPEEIVVAAIEKGFDEIGFSSHAMLPETLLDWGLTAKNIEVYAADIRALAAKYEGRIKVLCGVEADYAPMVATPDRSVFSAIRPDYIIGSVHFVAAPDGAFVCVDESPESLKNGIRDHFSGNVEEYIRAYFAQVRRMMAECDFDIVGHIDLVSKIIEINTGAISRGWLEDPYPSVVFRDLLTKAGAHFVIGSDAHSSSALDCVFDRFA